MSESTPLISSKRDVRDVKGVSSILVFISMCFALCYGIITNHINADCINNIMPSQSQALPVISAWFIISSIFQMIFLICLFCNEVMMLHISICVFLYMCSGSVILARCEKSDIEYYTVTVVFMTMLFTMSSTFLIIAWVIISRYYNL